MIIKLSENMHKILVNHILWRIPFITPLSAQPQMYTHFFTPAFIIYQHGDMILHTCLLAWHSIFKHFGGKKVVVIMIHTIACNCSLILITQILACILVAIYQAPFKPRYDLFHLQAFKSSDFNVHVIFDSENCVVNRKVFWKTLNKIKFTSFVIYFTLSRYCFLFSLHVIYFYHAHLVHI